MGKAFSRVTSEFENITIIVTAGFDRKYRSCCGKLGRSCIRIPPCESGLSGGTGVRDRPPEIADGTVKLGNGSASIVINVAQSITCCSYCSHNNQWHCCFDISTSGTLSGMKSYRRVPAPFEILRPAIPVRRKDRHAVVLESSSARNVRRAEGYFVATGGIVRYENTPH